MINLTKLKDQQKYEAISITDDLTQTERKLIKHWLEKAKERNEKENDDHIWRVRGSPSRGLYLKRTTRRVPRV